MGATVLVVEDEPQIQELVAVNLEHSGHEVLRASSAEEAEAAIRAALPDVVVLDWMLPGESGLALARRLRADARTRELPILMLTARALEQDKLSGLEAGADDYLTKPFSPKELAARIKAVLRRRAPPPAGGWLEREGPRPESAGPSLRAAGLVVGLLAGAAWGWGIVAVGLGASLLYHLRHLARLAHWAQEPNAEHVPEGGGPWEALLSSLYRHERSAEHRQRELADALAR